jgi:hypothetical protein
MARRSREHRNEIPGYDESRPSSDDRKQQHRATRHAAHQQLHIQVDPDELVLPEERRSRAHESSNGNQEPRRRRFRLWKTRFWKRRAAYRERKAAMDADWPVITPEQLGRD